MDLPNWQLNDDCKTVTLTLPSNPWTFSTTDIDDVLNHLGLFRSALKPEHSYDDPRRQKRKAVLNPRWAALLLLLACLLPEASARSR